MRGCHFLGARVTQKVVSSSIWVAGPQQAMFLADELSLQTLTPRLLHLTKLLSEFHFRRHVSQHPELSPYGVSAALRISVMSPIGSHQTAAKSAVFFIYLLVECLPTGKQARQGDPICLFASEPSWHLTSWEASNSQDLRDNAHIND